MADPSSPLHHPLGAVLPFELFADLQLLYSLYMTGSAMLSVR